MNIKEIALQSGIIYDRYLGSSIELPYSDFEVIKLKQNDTVTTHNLNSVINKLYENYLYLYKVAHVASNIIPLTSVTTIGALSGGLSCYYGLSTSQFKSLSSIGISDLDKSNVLSVKYNSPLNKYVVFTSSGPTLNVLYNDNTFSTTTTAYSASTIINGIGTAWGQIKDFAFGDNNEFYVLDLSGSKIIQYNATGFLTDNNILQNIFVYQNNIGGVGNYDDRTGFNLPQSLTFYNSYLYVLDAGNSCIKQYDSNLNWITTYRLFNDFLSAFPIQLSHDLFGNMYVLNNNNTILKYDSSFNNKIILKPNILTGDKNNINRIVFSASDSNVFYFITDTNIYKALVDYPEDTIGRYLISRFNVNTNEKITAMDSISATINGISYDYNYVFSTNKSGNNKYNVGKIFVFLDNINPVSILINDDFDVYTLDDISIDKDEYLQSWVINKSISKLLINHMRLRDEIVEKFLYKKDPQSGDILLSNTRYLLPNELSSMQFQQDLNNYIGLNEIFQNNIINRPFEYILKIQQNLLSALTAEVQDYLQKPQIVYIG